MSNTSHRRTFGLLAVVAIVVAVACGALIVTLRQTAPSAPAATPRHDARAQTGPKRLPNHKVPPTPTVSPPQASTAESATTSTPSISLDRQPRTGESAADYAARMDGIAQLEQLTVEARLTEAQRRVVWQALYDAQQRLRTAASDCEQTIEAPPTTKPGTTWHGSRCKAELSSMVTSLAAEASATIAPLLDGHQQPAFRPSRLHDLIWATRVGHLAIDSPQ